MSLARIPDEVLTIILDWSAFEKNQAAAAKVRKEKAILWTKLDRRLRNIAINHRPLWSTIHLQWSPEMVQLFLDRSRRRNLSVYLETRAVSSKNKALKQIAWTNFFTDEMANIVFLKANIDEAWENGKLAKALARTPAPKLRHLELIYDHGRASPIDKPRLFNNQAPLLGRIELATDDACALKDFSSLQEVVMRVGPNNFRTTLERLSESTSIVTLTIKGTRGWRSSPVPAPPVDHKPFQLSCTSLAIQDINSLRSNYIVSNIQHQNLRHLAVHENMVPNTDQPTVPFLSVVSTFPRLSLPKDSHVKFTFYPTCFALEVQGFHYLTGWSDAELLSRITRDSIFESILNAIHVVWTTNDEKNIPVTHLTIVNKILPPHDKKTKTRRSTKAPPKKLAPSMDLDDLEGLLAYTFHVFDAVYSLKVEGYATPVVDVLVQTNEESESEWEEYYLPELAFIQIGPTPGTTDEPYCSAESLSTLKTQREEVFRLPTMTRTP
ncbi:hypothetical protein SISNIDRAFT_552874 [Sistotremastrum niveocremeum HHB9708]|uniref:F-box domain-containing protein n=1 Tax=Sistotremastrum niveocremeum HHB9708 TaxID=1314777 RepID=A0A164NU09_9AGAM|nr:hypothetical protein SISNIDRAFT_552874 [Sistotremastrum niveocremeum HHB9708]